MTIHGPAHFLEAQRLLDTETPVDWGSDDDAKIANHLALAQCRATEAVGHALLALTAATAGLYVSQSSSPPAKEWAKALDPRHGAPPEERPRSIHPEQT